MTTPRREQEIPFTQDERDRLCDAFKHTWVEEYYGHRCQNCDLFFPFGYAPWDTEDDDDAT